MFTRSSQQRTRHICSGYLPRDRRAVRRGTGQDTEQSLQPRGWVGLGPGGGEVSRRRQRVKWDLEAERPGQRESRVQKSHRGGKGHRCQLWLSRTVAQDWAFLAPTAPGRSLGTCSTGPWIWGSIVLAQWDHRKSYQEFRDYCPKFSASWPALIFNIQQTP
jgi:hypothetical protein